MGFTFYGDLLGISSIYRLSPTRAYEKLNDFYNTTFFSIEEQWALEENFEAIMIADSLVAWGENPKQAIEKLSVIYTKLLHKGLLLRGAMVEGKLAFEPRLDRHNFKKMLPKDDTLARAVGLERTQKGARFIVESQLAQVLLKTIPEWLTHDGYIQYVNVQQIPHEHILRRLSPTPDGAAYEVLYFWLCCRDTNQPPTDYRRKKEELGEIRKMVQVDIGEHYRATVDLLKRCGSRQRFTEKNLRAGI